MYGRRDSGLGFAWMPILTGLVLPVGATVSSALATRFISRPSSPSQEEIERQIKLQHQLEIERMLVQQRQTEQVASFALPAIGILALVMLLR